jgi:hypothetical protein
MAGGGGHLSPIEEFGGGGDGGMAIALVGVYLETEQGAIAVFQGFDMDSVQGGGTGSGVDFRLDALDTEIGCSIALARSLLVIGRFLRESSILAVF